VIESFSAVFYLFAALLLFLAWRQLRTRPGQAEEPRALRYLSRVLPVTDRYRGARISLREDGRRRLTPIFVAIVAVGMIDLVFALDSIPAVFGLTQEPFIVFTANVFALMGLRQLYFLITGLVGRLVYLPQGLAVILGFIGVRLLLHALHENELPFINGGEGVRVPELPVWLSLAVVGGALAVAIGASLLHLRTQRRRATWRACEPETGAHRRPSRSRAAGA